MIFKGLTRKYKKLSYRKKVFSGMFFSAFIPILICSIGVLISFRLSNESKLKTQAENVIYQTNEKVDNICGTIKESLHKIAYAPATLRLLEKTNDNDDESNVYRLIYTSAMSDNRYADYALYDKNGKLVLYAGDSTYIKQELSVNWGILYELSCNSNIVRTRCGRLYGSTSKDILLRMGQAVVGKNGEIEGFVIAQVTESSFMNLFGGLFLDGTGAIYLFDDFNELFFSSAVVNEPEITEAMSEMMADGALPYISKGEESRYYYAENEENDIHVLYMQHVEPYNVMNRSLLIYLSLAGIAGLIVSLFMSRNLSHMFYRPIRRMDEAMSKIKQGDFDARVKVDSEDELGHLSEAFNDMSSKLNENMEELVNREKELAKANIKMMQAQLNPHFIYNTLDTMKWIAKDNEIQEVATLSSGLAEILRASISSGQTVSLKKEIELVESYAAIQQIRFADKFIFLTDVPEELLNCEVPKLILQPIVENAIIHGFDGRDYGQVLVSGYRDGDKVILSVKDDGIGISEEIALKLNNHEQLAKGTNIGFHNVDAIIRLHYGDLFGLKVKKNENGGTEVVYTLPYKTVIL